MIQATISNAALEGEEDLYCGEMSDGFTHDWMQCQYWCEGVLFSIVGSIGILGNIIIIAILLTR